MIVWMYMKFPNLFGGEKKPKGPSPERMKAALGEQRSNALDTRIEELKAHIESGNGTPDDGRLLEQLKRERDSA